jgi:hypothetical protein
MAVGDRVYVVRNPKLVGRIVRISGAGGFVVAMGDGLFNSIFDASEIAPVKA